MDLENIRKQAKNETILRPQKTLTTNYINHIFTNFETY